MMHTRITSLLTALALTFACTEHGLEQEPPDASETSTAEPGKPKPDTQLLLDPHQLEPAPWPDELHSVVMQLDDNGTVVLDALDHDGLLVARVELDPVDGSPTVIAVNATFADARSWALVDLENVAVVSTSTDPSEEATQMEIASRIELIIATLGEQDVNPPNRPQPGPWFDCALRVLVAVFSCLPTNPGWGVTCPKAVVDTVCTCHAAAQAKKKKKKPAPAVCG